MTLAPWRPTPGYLNTASFGIPCPQAAESVQNVIAAWTRGELSFAAWFTETQRVRESVAQLLQVPAEHVALGTSTATLLGSIAANLPNGARVLAPENEHNSNLLPYLNQAHRRVTVRLVPLVELAARVAKGDALVSCSAVQSLTGEVADIQAIREATRSAGAIFCLDCSQSCGWLPVTGDSADVIVCSMYKWLCAPIGGAFLVMRPGLIEQFRPAAPGWPASSDPLAPPYGVEAQLASSARKFDSAQNLISMIGAKRSIDAILELGVPAIGRHDLALANRFRAGRNLPPSNSAIVSLSWEGAAKHLAAAGIRATEWRGNLRLSFHLHNSEEDVDRTLYALASISP
jgi:selenocysteine lyase/cysteine desulfurase